MELVLSNPFRVLGLPATASARDLAKRVSDLETFAELGKVKSYPHDLPGLGPLDRSLEAVKTAARKIEQAEGRLFHSFFWFRAGDSVDELALESVATGNMNEAREIWNKSLKKKSAAKRYTWRLNRGVLSLLQASQSTNAIDSFNDALADLGFVIDDDLDSSIADVLAGNESSLSRESLWKQIVDELVTLVQSLSGAPYGKNGIRLIGALWSFPTEARDHAFAKIVNPLIEQVRDAIKRSEALRENADLNDLKSKNNLETVATTLKELGEALGPDDPRFQAIANTYAEEACACAVQALNEFDDYKLAHTLIQWADGLPSFSRVKARIEEELENIQAWVDQDQEEEVFGEIVKELKVDIYTLTQAATMLDQMRSALAKIKGKVGSQDERYIKVSSACAHRILGFLIETVNDAQQTFSSTKNVVDLQSTVSSAVGLTKRLLLLDLDSGTRARVDKNLKTIQEIDTDLSAAMTARAQRAASSNNIFDQIPGWMWLVGVVVLISMCSGK
jgi:hypothetical protein